MFSSSLGEANLLGFYIYYNFGLRIESYSPLFQSKKEKNINTFYQNSNVFKNVLKIEYGYLSGGSDNVHNKRNVV